MSASLVVIIAGLIVSGVACHIMDAVARRQARRRARRGGPESAAAMVPLRPLPTVDHLIADVLGRRR